jgi:hypothetical protein
MRARVFDLLQLSVLAVPLLGFLAVLSLFVSWYAAVTFLALANGFAIFVLFELAKGDAGWGGAMFGYMLIGGVWTGTAVFFAVSLWVWWRASEAR